MITDHIMKTIIHLKENEGKSWTQIGKVIGLSGNATRKRYYRHKRSHLNENQSPNQLGVSVEKSGNIIDCTSKSTRIKTLEQLIQECKIDLDEWEIVSHIINKWEFGVNTPDGVQIEPLFQVKAKLIKKNPTALVPFINSVNLPSLPKLPRPYIDKDYKTALILPDIHIGFSTTQGETFVPYHDRRCMKLALDIIEYQEFDEIIMNGDTLDLPEFSDYFIRKPFYRNVTQAALIEAALFISKIRELSPFSEIVYMDGNHENRANTMLLKYFSAAYGLRPGDETDLAPLFSIPRMLSLHKSDVVYVSGYPNEEYWLNDQILITHGHMARNNSGGTASAIIKDIDYTVCFGHVHRQEMASRTIHGRDGNRTVFAFSPGCMCRIDGAVPAKREKQNWQQGFGLIHYTDEELLGIETPSIENGRILCSGDLLTTNIKEYEQEITERINQGLKELDK